MQPDVFADAVVVMVKNALAPVLADVKSLQAQVATWEARWNDVGALRERVAIVETKAAPVPTVDPPAAVDLSPVLERLAASEARLSVLGDLRDRVVVVETKANQPTVMEPSAPVDLSPVIERLTAAESRLDVVATKAAEAASTLLELTKENATLRERIAVAEVRQLVPGPRGEKGEPGEHGTNGRDGTLENLKVLQLEDERSVTFAFKDGTPMDGGVVRFPVEIYRGVYQDGKTYERGDGVTWAGSEWHCNEPTSTKPGDGSKAWTLKVKRGRDGKDGRDLGPPPIPVVKR